MVDKKRGVLQMEEQVRLSRGIVVGRDYTFGLSLMHKDGNILVHGTVESAIDGWVKLKETGMTINLNSNDIVFFVEGDVSFD